MCWTSGERRGVVRGRDVRSVLDPRLVGVGQLALGIGAMYVRYRKINRPITGLGGVS
ncbi:hypothetical protein [Streptomyces sp. BE133]|uniref:hypothetical protein n=1 Tax=Streptomyces sp. BE133 TaxID=3002523 RepID=UPI002E7A31D8|nr:hypothetical protein [Streptomyces sp. BE133]MEE1808099.1 hypothetical protein [Streptomyces sp. BE133]